VNDPTAMRGGERVSDLDRRPERLVDRQRSAKSDIRHERARSCGPRRVMLAGLTHEVARNRLPVHSGSWRRIPGVGATVGCESEAVREASAGPAGAVLALVGRTGGTLEVNRWY